MWQIMALDVGTALAAVAPLLFISIPQPTRTKTSPAEATPAASFGADLREGLRYALSWRGLAIIMLMAMALNFLLTPATSLVPILVTKYFGGGAAHMAAQEMAFGVGMIAGGLVLSAWGGFKRRIYTSLTGLIGLGIGFLLIGLVPPWLFAAAVACFFMLGVMNPICNGPIFAVLQSSVAPHMQGRIMSLLMTGSVAMTPLSLLIAGPIADAFGVQVWFVIGGVLCLVIAVGGLFIPDLVNIEAQKAQHAGGGSVEMEDAVVAAAASK
jgi:DHA3 family macrolide efflux protein-like MFS transporter